MKRKIIAALLAVLMLLSFAACGEKTKTETDAEPTAGQTVALEETTEKEKEEATTEDTAEEQTAEQKEDTRVFGDFESTDMNGNKVDYTVFKGNKVTMVNIWATFCGPCIREMPDLQKLSEDYADKGLKIVGIACDADGELIAEAESIIEQTGVKYLNILPSESLMQAKLQYVYSVPETVFVDENGNQIGESYVGSRNYEDWAGIIESVLAQDEG